MDGPLERWFHKAFNIEYLVPLLQRGILVAQEQAIAESHQYGQLVTLAMIEVAPRRSALAACTMQMTALRPRRTTPTALRRQAHLCHSRQCDQHQQQASQV